MEKNMKKNVCMCVTESLCCPAEINTTLSINYTSVKNNYSSSNSHTIIIAVMNT